MRSLFSTYNQERVLIAFLFICVLFSCSEIEPVDTNTIGNERFAKVDSTDWLYSWTPTTSSTIKGIEAVKLRAQQLALIK